jgi:hypothetical protein
MFLARMTAGIDLLLLALDRSTSTSPHEGGGLRR